MARPRYEVGWTYDERFGLVVVGGKNNDRILNQVDATRDGVNFTELPPLPHKGEKLDLPKAAALI